MSVLRLANDDKSTSNCRVVSDLKEVRQLIQVCEDIEITEWFDQVLYFKFFTVQETVDNKHTEQRDINVIRRVPRTNVLDILSL